MTDLRSVELAFTRALDPHCSEGDWQAAQALINTPPSGIPAQRLKVYRGNVTGALARALELTYPVCLAVVGDDCFSAFATEYVWGQGEQVDDLDKYGAGFAQHLAQVIEREPLLADYSYLPELAAFEWACHRARLAPESQDVISLADIDAAEFAAFTPVLRSDFGLLENEYPVWEIWRRHMDDRAPEQIATLTEPQRLVIHGAVDGGLLVGAVDGDLFRFLVNCMKHKSLEQIVLACGSSFESSLLTAMRNGWLCGFERHDETRSC